MLMKEIIKGNEQIKVVTYEEKNEYLTDSDKEMDARARQAVKTAIEKAEFCKKPVTRYDVDTHKSYIEYPNGDIKYGK